MKTYPLLAGILTSAFIISGCATQSQLAKIDEYAWAEYKCSGFQSWNDCKQAARMACPDGFFVRNQFENYTIQRREFEAACKS